MDDNWQFFGPEENVDTNEAKVVLLEEIITIDPSVKELLDLPLGTAAYRKSKETQWVRAAKN